MKSLSNASPLAGLAFFLAFAFPCLAQDPSGSAPEKPAVFMAYNLKNYLAMDRRVGGEVVEGAPKPENEIAALIEVIAREKPDILGVCEIGDEPFLLDLQKRLKAKGVDLPETELIHAASGWERNLGLLTRFPIVSRQSRGDLSYTIEQTRLPFQRGILDVTLKLSESYRLRCVGLHLKSKREVPEAPQEEMRRHEAHLARQHLDEIFAAEPGANVLVYGDMNEDPPEPPIKALRGRFGGQGYLSDLRLRDRYGFRWTHYWEFADNYSRFDYALVSQGLLPEIDRDRSHIPHAEGWDTASDHRPLVVYLTPRDR